MTRARRKVSSTSDTIFRNGYWWTKVTLECGHKVLTGKSMSKNHRRNKKLHEAFCLECLPYSERRYEERRRKLP